MTIPDREHPAFGRLRWDVESWVAKVEIEPGSSLDFSIVAEARWADFDPEALFAIGAEYLDWARRAESTCRGKIADDLLGLYNGSWADDDPEEGPPPLDRQGFLSRLRPVGIMLFHDGTAEWIYTAGDLFAGHGIEISMAEDRTSGRATLFGWPKTPPTRPASLTTGPDEEARLESLFREAERG